MFTSAGLPQLGLATEIRVRGQGKLYADIQAAGTSAQIAGVLRDELGQPLPQRPIELKITRDDSQELVHEQLLLTDMQGRFGFQQSMPQGRYLVTINFLEDDHLDGAQASRVIELVQAPYRLEVQGPSLVVGRKRAAPLRLRATVSGVGVRTDVEVFVNEQRASLVELDHYGRGAFDVRDALVPGANQIRVVLPSKGQDSPGAQATTMMRFAQEAKLNLTLSMGHDRFERGLKVSGEVTDSLGPLAGGEAIVEFERIADKAPAQDTRELIEAMGQDDEPITERPPAPPTPPTLNPQERSSYKSQGKVDERGRFVGFAPQQSLRDGLWRARVIYMPEVGAPVTQQTETQELDRSASRWILHLLGLLTIVIGVGVLAQRQYLGKFAALLRRRRAKPQPLNFDQDEPLTVERLDDQDAGPSPAGSDGIAGIIWDAWRRAPIPGALILIQRSPGADAEAEILAQAHADERGQFRLEGLPLGEHELVISAQGFARGRMMVQLPHHGQLSATRISLVAIPLKIRRFYQAWVQRWHGQDAWGTLSPRQIEAALWSAMREATSTIDDPAVRDHWHTRLNTFLADPAPLDSLNTERLMVLLTELVEESYFSGRIYEESLWRLLIELTRKLEAGLNPSAVTRDEAP